jgi:hypothetical protein
LSEWARLYRKARLGRGRRTASQIEIIVAKIAAEERYAAIAPNFVHQPSREQAKELLKLFTKLSRIELFAYYPPPFASNPA